MRRRGTQSRKDRDTRKERPRQFISPEAGPLLSHTQVLPPEKPVQASESGRNNMGAKNHPN